MMSLSLPALLYSAALVHLPGGAFQRPVVGEREREREEIKVSISCEAEVDKLAPIQIQKTKKKVYVKDLKSAADFTFSVHHKAINIYPQHHRNEIVSRN
ncbi:hypothetical protein chiPu_0005198 [Chiloscyllium punctatum]|uniref:Complement C3/4/5 macroglobulin domain-containing protein n=1 Tax=Chiloscyllium punctatum TaxID=137246 RepID=A0A401S8P2_CHIPU|nr:hypothetical protein [Chiloscyllium punctatum]